MLKSGTLVLSFFVLGLCQGCNLLSKSPSADSSLFNPSAAIPIGHKWMTSDKLFIADTQGQVIRVIDRNSGIISAFTGNGTAGYSTNTAISSAQVSYPVSLLALSDNELLFSDPQSGCVQSVKNGVVNTFAGICGSSGNAGDLGPATSAQLSNPSGLCMDSKGNIIITDTGNHTVRKVSNKTGIITTIAGNGTSGYDSSKDGGSALLAPLGPVDCAFDANDNLYLTNWNNAIQKITPEGIISTIAGNGNSGSSGDGGPASDALVNSPEGVDIDEAKGILYFADSSNAVVRKINLNTGIITTFAGTISSSGETGDGSAATSAKLQSPDAVAFNGGEVFISDGFNQAHSIRKVNADGIISTIIGGASGGSYPFTDDIAASTALVIQPYSWVSWAD